MSCQDNKGQNGGSKTRDNHNRRDNVSEGHGYKKKKPNQQRILNKAISVDKEDCTAEPLANFAKRQHDKCEVKCIQSDFYNGDYKTLSEIYEYERKIWLVVGIEKRKIIVSI